MLFLGDKTECDALQDNLVTYGDVLMAFLFERIDRSRPVGKSGLCDTAIHNQRNISLDSISFGVSKLMNHLTTKPKPQASILPSKSL